jgi:pimeloyl-ACP methyl ester carboxylesterase
VRLTLGIAGGIASIIAAVLALGAGYETLASSGDAARLGPTGTLVDVGGARMHLDCRGTGSPTVVMDAGLGGSSLDWSLVQPAIAATTRVCVYDRAGMGWSDPASGQRSPSRIASELHALLLQAGEHGPYVLVGHSLAGKNARMFAAAFPDEVSGLVLVDARSELIDRRLSPSDAEGFDATLKGQAVAFSWARRLGVVRLFGAALMGEPLVPADTALTMELLQTSPPAIEEALQEGLARADDDAALAAASLGSLPLVVIAAGANMTGLAHWDEAQHALADLSTNGRLVVANGSGHYVQLEQPGLVIDGIRQVVASARSGS